MSVVRANLNRAGSGAVVGAAGRVAYHLGRNYLTPPRTPTPAKRVRIDPAIERELNKKRKMAGKPKTTTSTQTGKTTKSTRRVRKNAKGFKERIKSVIRSDAPAKHYCCTSGSGLTISNSSPVDPYVHNLLAGIPTLRVQSTADAGGISTSIPARYCREGDVIDVEAIRMKMELRRLTAEATANSGSDIFLRMALVRYRINLNQPGSGPVPPTAAVGAVLTAVPATDGSVLGQNLFLAGTYADNGILGIWDAQKVTVLDEWNLKLDTPSYYDPNSGIDAPVANCVHYDFEIPLKLKFTYRADDPGEDLYYAGKQRGSKWDLLMLYWFESPENGVAEPAIMNQTWDVIFKDVK